MQLKGLGFRDEHLSWRDSVKVAQYEVLGNDVIEISVPAGDDRNVWLLISLIRLRERNQPIDRPSGTDVSFNT